ncbi:hypothetical protein L1887_05100 [Cichorium endivia]|nr:hypothetical protein L1887_05100 [Cichorium endivia]
MYILLHDKCLSIMLSNIWRQNCYASHSVVELDNTIAREDMDVVDHLDAMGVQQDVGMGAFFACDKNTEFVHVGYFSHRLISHRMTSLEDTVGIIFFWRMMMMNHQVEDSLVWRISCIHFPFLLSQCTAIDEFLFVVDSRIT